SPLKERSAADRAGGIHEGWGGGGLPAAARAPLRSHRSSEPTQALGTHACLRVASNLAAAGPTLLPVFRSRKSCRDLPVFSFPLEALFPSVTEHVNKDWQRNTRGVSFPSVLIDRPTNPTESRTNNTRLRTVTFREPITTNLLPDSNMGRKTV
ncbi:hypothetical protein GOODEAATRI_003738, partial [Goodea atripinnis]